MLNSSDNKHNTKRGCLNEIQAWVGGMPNNERYFHTQKSAANLLTKRLNNNESSGNTCCAPLSDSSARRKSLIAMHTCAWQGSKATVARRNRYLLLLRLETGVRDMSCLQPKHGERGAHCHPTSGMPQKTMLVGLLHCCCAGCILAGLQLQRSSHSTAVIPLRANRTRAALDTLRSWAAAWLATQLLLPASFRAR